MQTTSEKVLHSSEELFQSEDYVIGCLVKDYAFAINLCETVRFKEEFFESSTAKAIWKTCALLEAHGDPIDPASVILRLEATQKHIKPAVANSYLKKAMSIATDPHDLMFHLNAVIGRYQRRKAIEIAQTAIVKLENQEDVEDALTHMEHHIRKVVIDESISSTESIDDLVTRMKKGYLSRGSQGSASLKSRWSLIQDMLGGYRFGKITVIGARPKQGKSTFALNEAIYSAYTENISGTYFSIEMDREELIEKAASDITKMDNFQLHLGNFSKKDVNEFVENGVKEVLKSKLIIIDQPSMTIEFICTKIRRLYAEKKIKFAVIDYLQIISSSIGSRFQSRTYEIAHWLSQLRAVAKETGIALILLSQINRRKDVEPNSMPTMSELKDSGSIEQDAYAILLIGSSQNQNTSLPSWTGCHPVCIRVDANRGGKTGDIEMVFAKCINRFMSWSEYNINQQNSFVNKVKGKSVNAKKA